MNTDEPVAKKEIDETLRTQKKLVRQLRWLNISLTIFGLLGLLGFAVMAFLLFQVLLFAKDTGQKFDSLQQGTTQKLDVKSQACADSSLGEFLRNSTTVCD